MEDFATPAPAAPAVCAACLKQITNDDAFCDSCGYPLKGTQTEQQNFIDLRSTKEIDLQSANKKIQDAGKALYWIAGLTLVSGLIFFALNKSVPLLIINFILTGIFFGLGLWSKSKPMVAIVSGFSLYVLMIILNAIEAPLTILSGIIVKIIIIGLFIKGIKSVIDAEKLKKDLNIE